MPMGVCITDRTGQQVATGSAFDSFASVAASRRVPNSLRWDTDSVEWTPRRGGRTAGRRWWIGHIERIGLSDPIPGG
jgi:hypothetical protein